MNFTYAVAVTHLICQPSTDLKQGGFFSAEDADSEGEEGKFYLWTEEELMEILGEKDASFYAAKFQFNSKGIIMTKSLRN